MQQSSRQPLPINTLAIVSAGLASLTIPGTICFSGFITGISAVIIGRIAVWQIRTGDYHKASKPIAIASIAVSLVALIFNFALHLYADNIALWLESQLAY